ncbi:TetR family transcriptional regulator [Nocardioides sp. W3-2-3]|nr:TetR family transcriptional regulator [Nocardioides convexus]
MLDAALRIIDRDGYDRVSIDAVAKEAGVTRPVVYGAYDGLGPLLMALLERQQKRALGQALRRPAAHRARQPTVGPGRARGPGPAPDAARRPGDLARDPAGSGQRARRGAGADRGQPGPGPGDDPGAGGHDAARGDRHRAWPRTACSR